MTRGNERSAVRWLLGLAAGALMVVSGCDVASMAFFRDERVRVIEPADRSTVSLPVTLRWEADGFAVTGRDGRRAEDAGYFAVFVDRPPIPPGRTLEWFVRQDESCGGEPCGSVKALSDVYTTKRTSLEVARLPAVSGNGDIERHEAVVVLLDGTGARIGESAFYVRFNFDRKAEL